MSTRSYIAMKRGGNYECVYCHWDGYPDYNGKILLTHYNNPQKILKLLNNGSLSSLGEEIDPNPNFVHTFEEHQDGVCVFYCRDRHEPKENTQKQKYKTIADMLEAAEGSWAEFVYVFEDDNWSYYSLGERGFSQKKNLAGYFGNRGIQ